MSYAIAVIGSNFGDEGKGLVVDYFCDRARTLNESCIVVCHNGGAQRGHTVVLPDRTRHIFHHFGSGTFTGARTYLSKDFILNPMTFRKEYEELVGLGYIPEIYVNFGCRYTTPFDMIVNQILEESRDTERHGSCGMGIWETVLRYENFESYRISDTLGIDMTEYLTEIRECYIKTRLYEANAEVLDSWKRIVYSNELVSHFIRDFEFMMSKVHLCDDSILDDFDCVVFEGGQGLLLDQSREEFGDNITPSNTGMKNVLEICENISNLEYGISCYVSRTYLTRHGAGRFDEECDYREINMSLFDKTNVYNPFQGFLRYGLLDRDRLVDRTIEDSCEDSKWMKYLVLTHENEYSIDTYGLGEYYNKVFISDGQTRESIREESNS